MPRGNEACAPNLRTWFKAHTQELLVSGKPPIRDRLNPSLSKEMVCEQVGQNDF